MLNSEPGPLSSQSPSEAKLHDSPHPPMISALGPQSVQSLPTAHIAYSEPGPLSSQSPSDA